MPEPNRGKSPSEPMQKPKACSPYNSPVTYKWGAVIELWARSRRRKPTYIRRCISVALVAGGRQKLAFCTASMHCCYIKGDMKNGEWCFRRFGKISLART